MYDLHVLGKDDQNILTHSRLLEGFIQESFLKKVSGVFTLIDGSLRYKAACEFKLGYIILKAGCGH